MGYGPMEITAIIRQFVDWFTPIFLQLYLFTIRKKFLIQDQLQ